MPFVSVPKDLTKVKTKIALNLTKRQIVCFSLGAAVGVPLYFLLKPHLNTDFTVLIMMAAVLPFFFFAMYEKNGQPFEKVLKNIITVKFLRPAVRPYKTENFYHSVSQQLEFNKEVRRIVKNKSRRR